MNKTSKIHVKNKQKTPNLINLFTMMKKTTKSWPKEYFIKIFYNSSECVFNLGKKKIETN